MKKFTQAKEQKSNIRQGALLATKKAARAASTRRILLEHLSHMVWIA